MSNRLWERLLRSVSFRSGYRLVRHDDPRAVPVPRLDPAWESISLLHPRQIAGAHPDQKLIALYTVRLVNTAISLTRAHNRNT